MTNRSATLEDFQNEGLIGRYTACDMAVEKLQAAGFIIYGRSDKSEARYMGRPHSSKQRIRIAAHDGRREDVAAYIDFEDRETDDIESEMEIEGTDDVIVETRVVSHTGLDESDIDDLVADAIAAYDAQPEVE